MNLEVTTPSAFLAQVAEALSGLEIDPSKDNLVAVRLALGNVKQQVGKLYSKTRNKTVEAILAEYEEGEVEQYIDDILDGTWNTDKHKIKPVAEHDDLQKINLAKQIKTVVEQSQFGLTKFNIKHLQGLRSMIASSKSIHELRQLCKVMCLQLEYYNQNQVDDEPTWTGEIERLSNENEELRRIQDELMLCYEPGRQDTILLRNINNLQLQHNLSDREVVKIFDISRNKLNALRSTIILSN